MTNAQSTTRTAPSASVSGDGLVKHALNLRAVRAAKAGQFIVRNSGKSPLFQSLMRMPSPRVVDPPAVPRVQEMASTYSRDFPHLPFATAITNLGDPRRSSQLDRMAFGLAGPFGKLAGKGVAAPFARIFKVSPSRKTLAASPMLTKSGFP